jgi:GDSL-like lipase/acylhydrolase family protein
MTLRSNRRHALFLFAILFVSCSIGLFIPHEVNATTYNLIEDDNFLRANTSAGSGANSTTGIGNGWKDFVGNIYHIQSDTVVDSGMSEMNPPLYTFYHNATTSDSFQNGKVRVYYSAGYPVPIARFNPASSGSGYGFVFVGGDVGFYKTINGSTQFLPSVPVSGVPSNPIIEFVVQDIDSSDTLLTANFYNQSDPNTIVATGSYIDSSSPIQAPGYWGASQDSSGVVITRIQTYAYVPGGTITPGILSVTRNNSATSLSLASIPALGGISPYTYQWQRSTASTTGFVNIPSATNTSLADTGLTPGTTYFYRMDVMDSSTTPQEATSTTPIQATTLGLNEHGIGYIGDSITAGYGSNNGTTLTTGPGALVEYLTLQNDGYPLSAYDNLGAPATRTGNWQPGGSYFQNALASFETSAVDTVSIMLGTNDALNQDSTTTYATNMSNLIVGLLAPGTGITRVILNYPPYMYDDASVGLSHSQALRASTCHSSPRSSSIQFRRSWFGRASRRRRR